jgi:hypothetical protein
MIVALLTHAGDIAEARELLLWIQKLDPKLNHDLLIVADSGSPFDKVIGLKVIGNQIFKTARVVANSAPVSGWPAGPYSLFCTAIKNVDQPFLILEPDAVPTRKGWMDEIEFEYTVIGKPFLGHIYDGEREFAGQRFMSGIACYPADAKDLFAICETPVHWDVHYAAHMVNSGEHTRLIKHLFGQHNLPPRFVRERTPRTRPHEFTLDYLGDAALFHRDKSHSLIRLLRKKLFPNEILRKPIAVVFPVHNGDLEQAIHHATWLQRIAQPRWKHEAIVAFDTTINVVRVNQFTQQLRQCFETVHTFTYPRPPFQQYPHAANWAFQNVAYEMQRRDLPWLWMESDAIALRSTWLDELQQDYETCGADFIGPVVDHMGHLQGTSIYPPDTPIKMPGAMKAVDQAFDMEGKVGHLAHDSNRFCHVWSLVNRLPHHVGGGDIPVNITADEINRWLPREAVFLHRIKDLSVINLLLSGAIRP